MLEWFRFDQLLDAAKKIRRGNDEFAAGRGLHRLEIAIPIERGREFLDGIEAYFIVEVPGIAPLHNLHRRLRHCGFHLQHHFGAGFCLDVRSAREL